MDGRGLRDGICERAVRMHKVGEPSHVRYWSTRAGGVGPISAVEPSRVDRASVSI
jgi:hypothetical protein